MGGKTAMDQVLSQAAEDAACSRHLCYGDVHRSAIVTDMLSITCRCYIAHTYGGL